MKKESHQLLQIFGNNKKNCIINHVIDVEKYDENVVNILILCEDEILFNKQNEKIIDPKFVLYKEFDNKKIYEYIFLKCE